MNMKENEHAQLEQVEFLVCRDAIDDDTMLDTLRLCHVTR